LLVGAFQDKSYQVAIVHFIGAAMVFGFGIGYMWIQTLMSYLIYRISIARKMSHLIAIIIRLILSVLASIFFVIVIVSMQIASRQHIHQSVEYSTYYWDARNGGYTVHLISTVAEWCLGISFLLFFVTFHNDFLRLHIITTIAIRGVNGDGLEITESTPLTV
jgi:hypothetical protein